MALTKLFLNLYLVKFLDTSTKLFFVATNFIYHPGDAKLFRYFSLNLSKPLIYFAETANFNGIQIHSGNTICHLTSARDCVRGQKIVFFEEETLIFRSNL